jgi:hypothetical protein
LGRSVPGASAARRSALARCAILAKDSRGATLEFVGAGFLEDSDLLTLASTGGVAHLRAARIGSTRLFALARGLAASILVEVTEAAPVSLAVTSDLTTLPIAGIAHLSAAALYSDGARDRRGHLVRRPLRRARAVEAPVRTSAALIVP